MPTIADFNDMPLFAKPAALKPGPDRSWHETLTQMRLMPDDNQLASASKAMGALRSPMSSSSIR
jgi:hypothetical protein